MYLDTLVLFQERAFFFSLSRHFQRKEVFPMKQISPEDGCATVYSADANRIEADMRASLQNSRMQPFLHNDPLSAYVPAASSRKTVIRVPATSKVAKVELMEPKLLQPASR